MTLLVAVAAALASLGTVHAIVNAFLLRRPVPLTPVHEPVSVLVPARDEAERISALLTSLTAQYGIDDLEVLVLDDDSQDHTADLVRTAMRVDPRLRLIEGEGAPPTGWLGKPWACQRLLEQARGSIVVVVDADVVLAPDAIARTVATMRTHGLHLASPYPRQVAVGMLERLVQPLLQWSWLTTLPLRIAETSARPSLAAANGQVLAVDSARLHAIGGFSAVRDEVLDDIALVRAIKGAGGRGGVIDGMSLATCRMYTSGRDLVAGYAKSLWSAFGSPGGTAGVVGLMLVAYVVPFLAAVAPWSTPDQRALGVVGYAAAVLGRVVSGQRTGARLVPDAFWHPASVAVFAWLNVVSWRGHRRGTLTWKGRAL